jgi:hypothetical protein
MSETFSRIIGLVLKGEIMASDHGYDEMAEDGIYAREVVTGVKEGVVVEDYPAYPKGPCVLVLQKDLMEKPIHVVWGIPLGRSSPLSS